MFNSKCIGAVAIASVVMAMGAARASQETIGPFGINSAGLTTFNNGQPLNGAGEDIGEVDVTRPGRPPADDPAHSNTTILPEGVFLHNVLGSPPANLNIDDHAEIVAGIMISTHPMFTGVATGARLFASAEVGDVDPESQFAEAAQFIATRDLGVVSAINISALTEPPGGSTPNGNDLLTQFVDWSAAHHDVLYVTVVGDAGQPIGVTEPSDNFNGITVASSMKDSNGFYSLATTGTDYFDCIQLASFATTNCDSSRKATTTDCEPDTVELQPKLVQHI